MNVCKKKKLLEFMSNSENKLLTVWFFTLVTYVFLYVLFRNAFVLLFSYFICFVLYSKLFDLVYNKLKNSFKDNHTNRDLL